MIFDPLPVDMDDVEEIEHVEPLRRGVEAQPPEGGSHFNFLLCAPTLGEAEAEEAEAVLSRPREASTESQRSSESDFRVVAERPSSSTAGGSTKEPARRSRSSSLESTGLSEDGAAPAAEAAPDAPKADAAGVESPVAAGSREKNAGARKPRRASRLLSKLWTRRRPSSTASDGACAEEAAPRAGDAAPPAAKAKTGVLGRLARFRRSKRRSSSLPPPPPVPPPVMPPPPSPPVPDLRPLAKSPKCVAAAEASSDAAEAATVLEKESAEIAGALPAFGDEARIPIEDSSSAASSSSSSLSSSASGSPSAAATRVDPEPQVVGEVRLRAAKG